MVAQAEQAAESADVKQKKDVLREKSAQMYFGSNRRSVSAYQKRKMAARAL